MKLKLKEEKEEPRPSQTFDAKTKRVKDMNLTGLEILTFETSLKLNR